MTNQAVFALADYLREIARGSKTGLLRMTSGGRMRMVFFEDGALVYLVSDVAEENLAAFFARAGRIESAADRLKLFQLEKEVSRKSPLISLIAESGLRDTDTLRQWLVEYAGFVFGRAFDLHETPPKLAEGIRATHPLPIRLPVLDLILDAVHRMQDDESIAVAVGPLDYYTQPTDDAAALMSELPLSLFDGLIAAQISSKIALADVINVCGIAEPDVLRSILALRCTGIIEPFFEWRGLTDSGRMRVRHEAIETGYALTPDAAAAAMNLSSSIEDGQDGPSAVTLGELSGTAASPPAPMPPARGQSGPLVYPQPRPRGDTSRLKLLASAYIQMGEMEAASGNFAAASQCFESALSQKPNDLQTMIAYAAVLAKKQGGLSAAEKMLQDASDAHPKSALPHIGLARLYKQAGRLEDAEESLLDARRLEPNSRDVRLLQEELRQGPGLLSKLGFRSEAKTPPPSTPVRFASPPAQKPRRPTPGASSGAGIGGGQRCRHCRKLVKPGARVCMNCGATL